MKQTRHIRVKERSTKYINPRTKFPKCVRCAGKVESYSLILNECIDCYLDTLAEALGSGLIRLSDLADGNLRPSSKLELRLLRDRYPALFLDENVTGPGYITIPRKSTRNIASKWGPPTRPKRYCVGCKAEFYPNQSRQRFCFPECGARFRMRRMRRRLAGIAGPQEPAQGGVIQAS